MHVGQGRFELVGNGALEDGFADVVFDQADFPARCELEGFHDHFAGNRRLKIAQVVALLHCFDAGLELIVIAQEPHHLPLVA